MLGHVHAHTLVTGALPLPSELVRRTSGAGLRPPMAATAAGGACRSGCCAHFCTAPATVMQREWPSTTTSRAPSSCARRPACQRSPICSACGRARVRQQGSFVNHQTTWATGAAAVYMVNALPHAQHAHPFNRHGTKRSRRACMQFMTLPSTKSFTTLPATLCARAALSAYQLANADVGSTRTPIP